MVIMGMMYKENRQYAAIPLTEITTQEGEQVSITLPDKIVVLDRGCIAEEGTHRELTERKGMYYRLVKNQLELGS